jgi:zinc protease
MFSLLLMLFIHGMSYTTVPQQEAPQYVGPYKLREDQGQTTKVVLVNGLTVLVREQHATPLASITTYVKAGYFDEDDRISGIAHVIEHMFFKGTARRPVGEIARETKTLGGYLNAYTYYDRTVYYTVVPAENAMKALDIQADALWKSAFDADELKREIEVVLQENNRKLDNPPAVASEKLYSVAFNQHRMRRWRIGTPEGLRALTRDDVVGYYQRYYQPSNIILSVVGDIDREKVLAEVVKLYGGAADQTVDRDVSPAEPQQTDVRFGIQRGPIEQGHVALGFHGPAILSSDARALEVLAAIISEGRASRLNQYLRDEKGLITRGTATLNTFADVGFFELEVETTKPAEAQIGVLAELENIKRFGVTAEALARAKTRIAQDHLFRLETVNGVAEQLAFFQALGDWRKSQTYLSDIQRVTAKQVMDAAKKYLTPENLSAFEYLPQSINGQSSVDDYKQAVLAKVAGAVEERKETELPVSAAMPVLDNGIVNDIVRPVQKRSILRGPDVYIVEDHRLPLVSFGIFYPGGRLLESAKNFGITELMLRAALRGSGQFDSAGIARRLENAGAGIQVVNEPDFFGYIVEGLSGKTSDALEVLMGILQEPLFDEIDVSREKALVLARIKNLRENNYAYPVNLFLQTLFGDHSYGRPAIGTEETVQKLTRADLEDWYKRNERPVAPLIVIAGDTQGTGLLAPIADALTSREVQSRTTAALPAPDLKAERKEKDESADRQQTAIVYGFPGASLSSADRYPLTVYANIVSGLGGRFFDAIREKQGLAYTVSTSNTFFGKSGAVLTYTAASPANEAQVRAALEKEIEKLRQDGVTAAEVKKAVAYSIGDREIGLQTRNAVVLEYARSVYSGAGVESVSKYSDAIRAVTPESVKAAVLKYLTPESLRVAVVRGVKK